MEIIGSLPIVVLLFSGTRAYKNVHEFTLKTDTISRSWYLLSAIASLSKRDKLISRGGSDSCCRNICCLRCWRVKRGPAFQNREIKNTRGKKEKRCNRFSGPTCPLKFRDAYTKVSRLRSPSSFPSVPSPFCLPHPLLLTLTRLRDPSIATAYLCLPWQGEEEGGKTRVSARTFDSRRRFSP